MVDKTEDWSLKGCDGYPMDGVMCPAIDGAQTKYYTADQIRGYDGLEKCPAGCYDAD